MFIVFQLKKKQSKLITSKKSGCNLRRERNHLYDYALHNTQTARKNGLRLTSRLDRSDDDVNCFGASF